VGRASWEQFPLRSGSTLCPKALPVRDIASQHTLKRMWCKNIVTIEQLLRNGNTFFFDVQLSGGRVRYMIIDWRAKIYNTLY